MKAIYAWILAAIGLVAAGVAHANSSTVSLSAQGQSAPIFIYLWNGPPQNAFQQVFSNKIGALVYVSDGASLTASVQITGDQNPSANGNWLDACPNITGSAGCNIDSPITAMRLNVSNYVSGTVTMTVVQP
jgi:hypothetical protein